MTKTPLLDISHLSIDFAVRGGRVQAIDDISLSLAKGEVVALVGESGSGKSVASYAVMRILDRAARVKGGTVSFNGVDLLALKERNMAAMRGKRLAMIFQNARGALNPLQTVGDTMFDVIRTHGQGDMGASALRERAIAYLRQVRITDPERRLQAYPYELSGGMCQRVMIAAVLACEPELIIADEPTTGLDVTTQAVVMDTLLDLTRQKGLGLLLVTHDLALASEYCDRVIVMHAGHIVESASRDVFFAHPAHPYSAGLLASIPDAAETVDALRVLSGNLPDLRQQDLPACRFVGRCDRAQSACRVAVPTRELALDHTVKCLFPLVPAVEAAPPTSPVSEVAFGESDASNVSTAFIAFAS